ncbi:ETC complex I subunit [Azospirillum canadense]|uniref:ETC complex I subunit n=1 Tax=Azospirillum canadense TaxID=403962 RepID=UPI002225D1B1|nr:ETC complex I subunit [Azospirillum canadense]MCW2242520.1 hypothetical protein [Azospirillum canadense]
MANDADPLAPSPTVPPGTMALIHKPGRSATTSGKVRSCAWVLSFQPCSAQFVEPLMGWCGGDDPLRHVELRFRSRDAAVRFATRHGIPFEVDEPPRDRPTAVGCPEPPAAMWTDWMLDCLEPVRSGDLRWSAADVERAILNPAGLFRDPFEVVSHAALTSTEKRRILTSWEWDALRIEATQDEAWLDGEPSRLEEVRAALRALDGRAMVPPPANTDRRPGGTDARVA